MATPVRSVRSSSTRPISRRGRRCDGHAVAMALASKSILRLLLVRVDNQSFYSPTQGLRLVRDLLVGWGVLGKDAAYDRW